MNASQESDDHRLAGRHPRDARPAVPHRESARVDPTTAPPTEPAPGADTASPADGSDAGDEDAPEGQLDAVTRLMGFLRNSD